MPPRHIYATLKRRFSETALRGLGFRPEGSQMVKRGGCRVELASATSDNDASWRVTPLVRYWR